MIQLGRCFRLAVFHRLLLPLTLGRLNVRPLNNSNGVVSAIGNLHLKSFRSFARPASCVASPVFEKYQSLQFKTPLHVIPYPQRKYVLIHKKYPATSSPRSRPYKFHDFEAIDKKVPCGVCRVWTGPRDKPGSLSFIVKFVIGGPDKLHNSLEREARIYNDHLKSLQGSDIPTFFGLYEGSVSDKFSKDPARVTCMILEDCGEAVECYFFALPLADRAQILKKVGRIHLCGVTLNDFAERNVVQKDGSYRIIDFEHVETGHKCKWTDGEVYEGGNIPKLVDIGCMKMYNLGMELDLWELPYQVSIYGLNVLKRDYPSQGAIDILIKNLDGCHPENEKRLHNWIKNYKKYQDHMSPEEYMQHFGIPEFSRPPRELGPDEYA